MNRSMTSVVRVLVPAIALSLGVAGVAAAEDTFGGCSKNKNGTEKMRAGSLVVNQSPACKSTETARTWNEEGPQGIPGFSDCQVEEFAGTNQANTFSVTNSSCSGGRKAVSAGAIWHTPFDAADNGPFYFFPRSSTLWTVIPWNHTGSAQEYRFFLQCCA